MGQALHAVHGVLERKERENGFSQLRSRKEANTCDDGSRYDLDGCEQHTILSPQDHAPLRQPCQMTSFSEDAENSWTSHALLLTPEACNSGHATIFVEHRYSLRVPVKIAHDTGSTIFRLSLRHPLSSPRLVITSTRASQAWPTGSGYRTGRMLCACPSF